MTEIPEEVVEIAAKAAWDAGVSGEFPWATVQPESQEAWRREARAAVAAALPHLRVQETAQDGLREYLEDMCVKAERRDAIRREKGERPVPARVGVDVIRSLLATHPTPTPRPVVDREALRAVVKYWLPCTERDDFVDAATDAVLALLPTEEHTKGEGS